MNCQCTTAAFTVSLKPEGFVTFGSLAHETWPCMRFLSVGSHFCTQVLPPHKPSRDCTCLRLMVIIGGLIRLQIRCWFTHRGLSPHKFIPMPGVPKVSRGLRLQRSPRIWCVCRAWHLTRRLTENSLPYRQLLLRCSNSCIHAVVRCQQIGLKTRFCSLNSSLFASQNRIFILNFLSSSLRALFSDSLLVHGFNEFDVFSQSESFRGKARQ